MSARANGSSLPIFVLDSFALLCYLGEEPGANRVAERLGMALAGEASLFVSTINWGEVVYITERERGMAAAHQALQAIEQLPLTLLDATRARVLAAAHLKANYPLSYADAFAVAAALELPAVIVTGDPEFRRVSHLVSIEWLSAL
jgi:predicted nucleic acid-binding protein